MSYANVRNIVCSLLISLCVQAEVNNKPVCWAVVGAGPAGIITVGLLRDLGISDDQIAWIDPEFNVGRLGEYYTNVPSNTKTKLFVNFIKACRTFQECKSEHIEKLYSYDQEIEYPLQIIVDPLRDITAYMRSKVTSVQDTIQSLYFENDQWHITTPSNLHLVANHVVLATGSHPRSLEYECHHEIALDVALNKCALAQVVNAEDCLAVIGSSHSAILVLKFLSELPVKRIINFYKNPLQYSVDMGTWTLHGANGLKGIAAQWAQEILEKSPPANLVRLYNCKEARDAWLCTCNKIVYAVGFERNDLPLINGTANEIAYDDDSGVIAPRLFGIGIAFPERYTDPLGNVEHRVGLNSFMEYAQRVVPQWLMKERSRFSSFEQLFMIDLM